MRTRRTPLLLLGATVALGAVIGLAPAGEAQPVGPPVIAIPTTTTTLVHPDPDPEPCVPALCDAPDDLADPCSLHPESCVPDTTPPDPGDPGDDGSTPTTEPDPADPGTNPDVIVVEHPRFTG